MISISVFTFAFAIIAAMLVTALLLLALYYVHAEREDRRRSAIEQTRLVSNAFAEVTEKHSEKIKELVREMMLGHEGKPL
jgi:hypothetical protein